MLRCICILMLFIPATVFAQRYKTIELKPITKRGWQYYYDLKLVSSPVALEVPLMALNDEEINRHFQAAKTLRNVSFAVSFVPLIYIFTIPTYGYADPTTFWLIVAGTLVTQLGMDVFRHIKLGKAIDRYNSLIFQPSSSSLGVQLTWKFL
jgi:hypothetical protein